MFHPRMSGNSAGAGNLRRLDSETRNADCRRRLGRVGALLAVVSALGLFACSDDRPEVLSDGPPTIADELRTNAESFDYTIGQPGGSLTLAAVSEPLTFNLALSKDASSSGVLGYLFEGLTETSWLSDEVEPALAESWTRSSDGLTWTFLLRQDVRWHDGEPFTAHDVEFTFNRIIYNPEIDASARATFTFRFPDEQTGDWTEAQMSVSALDDYTIRCVLPVTFAPFLRSMGTPIYPRHILEPYVDDGTFDEVWDIDTNPTEIVGTGPFSIDSYDPGEHLTLKRNAEYWLLDHAGNRLPYLDQIVYVIVADRTAQLSAFRDGVADRHAVRGPEFQELEPLQTEGNFTIHSQGPGFASEFLAFNMNPDAVPPEKLNWFQNTQFRRAVAHVVDRARIIDDAQHGLAYPQWSSISPAAGDFHNPDVRRHEYDVAEAGLILDTLGWVDSDGDGIREDEAGMPLTFTLLTNDTSPLRQEIAVVVQEGLADIGVEVDFRPISFGDLVDRLTNTYEWESVIIGLTGSPEPHDGMNVWHSSGNLHLWHPNQMEPATLWEEQIDELYVEASQELDRRERIQLYHQAQEIVAENVPLIYTTRAERLTALRNGFGNSTPTLYGLWDIRFLYRTDR